MLSRQPTNGPSTDKSSVRIRAVAIVEGSKGLLVLLAGFGLLSLIHHDVGRFAAGIVRHSHLNPASHYPRIFISAAASVTDSRLWFLALAALLYSAVRLIEAYGLWYRRTWAEIFAIITGAIYLPIEIYEIVERVTAVRITVFVVNALIVAMLSYERMRGSNLETAQAPGGYP
jgi:uncharacterized membrane protein (DUF2068 family)